MQFGIENAYNISLRCLEILRCGVISDVHKFSHPSLAQPSAFGLYNIRTVIVDNVHISYSQGSGLVALNCFESIILKNSKFDQNCKVVEGKGDENYGNVFLDYEAIDEGETKVEIVDSHFSNCYGGGGYSGGLNIDMHGQQTLNVSVYITSCIFSNNTGIRNGGNMRIRTAPQGHTGYTPLLFCIHIYNSSFNGGYADRGGGLYADLGPGCFTSSPLHEKQQCYCSISRTSFEGNIGGGLYIRHFSLNLLNVTFLENNASNSGGGVHVGGSFPMFTTITFTNTSFIRNKAEKGGGVYVGSNNVLTFLGSTFSGNMADNDGGGLKAYHVSMNIICCYFENNKAMTIGGAISTDLHATHTILGSQFKANAAEEGGHIIIHSWTEKCRHITVHFNGCILEGGSAERGGAISIRSSTRSSTYRYINMCLEIKVILTNCTFTRNNAIFGGIVDIYLNLNSECSMICLVEIRCTNMTNNYGSSLKVMDHTYGPLHVDFVDSNIEYSKADSGSIVQVQGRKYPIHTWSSNFKTSIMTVTNTHFFGSTFSQFHYDNAVIRFNVANITVTTGTTFINNTGSCIAAKGSDIGLQGHVKFMNNTAIVGAALHLDCTDDTSQPSSLFLFPNTTVTIANNTALYYGGGVAVNPVCDYDSSCFFQTSAQPNSIMHVYCQHNKALVAGSLYGPSVHHCGMVHKVHGGFSTFASLFQVEDGYFVDQVVLAPAYSVCFCENESKNSCSTVSAFPGTEFTVSALSTGMLNDISSNNIRATLTEIGSLGGKFGNGRLQEIQEVQRSCSQLMYSVISTNIAQINLQIDSVENAPPSYINITILQCPLGFQFDEDKEMCNCNDYLIKVLEIDITCFISNNIGEITVPGKSWIGMYSGKLAVHRFCPLDYCISELHSVDLRKQHLQCTNNRSGVLCGACQTGLSLGLGTARCLDNCSNYYLFLIIPFTLAGLAVTLMLLKCNITVSMGIINPLILDANIVHVNATIFFPQYKQLILTNILQVFIAWLNLDFGIETCFYRGMTAYGHT